MIKVINCKNKNYKKKIIDFLDKRRSGKNIDTSIVYKILKDQIVQFIQRMRENTTPQELHYV